jgi:hypothetical protein
MLCQTGSRSWPLGLRDDCAVAGKSDKATTCALWVCVCGSGRTANRWLCINEAARSLTDLGSAMRVISTGSWLLILGP